MTDRVLQSEYMHWAKTRSPVRYHLGSSEVPQVSLDAYVPDIAELELDGASRYRYPPLREAIAARAGVAAENVVMADGTSMANMLALATLIGPGDDVLVERPAYEPLVATARFLGANIRSFFREGPDFALNPAVIEEAIGPSTRLIILTNLHNPTGNLADEATLGQIGAIATRIGARVLIDEVYLDAAVPDQRSAALLGDIFVTTSSLTKCHGLSGLRCGWILAEPVLAERMWRLNELFGVAQAHAAERLSCIALANLDAIGADLPAHLSRNRALANAFFASRDDLEVAPMTAGITAFPRLLHGDVDRLNQLLREGYDTSIVPGRFFGLANHFRIGIGGSVDVVEGGLARLAAALDELEAA